MSKKKGKKKSRSEKRLTKVVLATAIIELLNKIIELLLKVLD